MIRPVSPVYWKELVQVANRRRTYLVRTLFVTTIFCLFALFWLTRGSWSSQAMRPTEASRFGHDMFIVLAWIEFGAAALFTPALTADLLTGEKRANTLSLLFLTRLSNFHVVQDKGLSRVTYLAQLLVLMVPFLFVCLMFGGVSTFQILMVQASVLSIVLMGLSASLFFSTVLPDYRSALSASFLFLILILIAPLVVALFFTFLSGWRNSPEDILAWTSPFYGMALAGSPYQMQKAAGSLLEYAWIGPLALSIVGYGGSVLLSAFLLPGMAVRHAPVQKPGVRGLGGLSTIKLLVRTPFLPFVLLAELIERKRSVGSNPVYWWEAGITGKRGRMQQLYISGTLGYAFVVIAVLIAALIDDYGRSDGLKMLTISFLVLSTFFLLLYAANAGGSAVASEREQNTLDVLLSTAITTRAVVLGKFLGVLRASLIHFLFPLLLVGFHQVLSEDLSALRLMVSLAFLVLYVVWAAALGVFFSSKSPTSVRAVGTTMGTLIGFVVVVLIVAGVVGDLVTWEDEFREWCLLALPGTWSVGLVVSEDFAEEGGHGIFGALLTVLFYGGSTVALLAWAPRRLVKGTGRG